MSDQEQTGEAQQPQEPAQAPEAVPDVAPGAVTQGAAAVDVSKAIALTREALALPVMEGHPGNAAVTEKLKGILQALGA